jgi:hypothetical protein
LVPLDFSAADVASHRRLLLAIVAADRVWSYEDLLAMIDRLSEAEKSN